MKYFCIPFLLIVTGVVTKPAMAQGVFATTVTTFQMSPMGHTVIERRINDSVQTSESSVSLTTDSQSGSSQTSNSEEGKTTRTNYNYGTTATSVAIENIDITREVKVEFREEYNYSEFSIDNSSSTGYSF